MHIVQVFFSPMPVKGYGGMERVIENLCEGFLTLGHKVTLISYQGEYEIPGVQHQYLDTFKNKKEAEKRFKELFPKDADMVHLHDPILSNSFDFPHVFTMHGNLQPHEDPETLSPYTIFLCEDHARRHQRSSFVFNGLNHESIPFSETSLASREYFSFLGRAKLRRKGLKEAKIISKRLGMRLVVGGGSGLSLGRVKYLGQVDNEKKFHLLKNSRALLFPISWEEPFGLVMIEAMFCGTPVFAFTRGSVSEVLGQSSERDQKLFILSHDCDEMIQQIETFSMEVSPQEIRNYAVKHFSHLNMCEKYLSYYHKLWK